MLSLIEIIRSKPSDRNIRIIRIVYAIILTGVLYFGLNKTFWNIESLPKTVLYVLYLFPLMSFVRGVFDPGVMRKKLWKWTQVGTGVIMMLISIFLIETNTIGVTVIPPTLVSGEISVANMNTGTQQSTFIVDTDFWFGFLGFWISLFGLVLSSKNITLKNERFGEKVTKIRV